MVDRVTWVLGQGGLFGSAMRKAASADSHRVFVPKAALPWNDEAALTAALSAAVDDFGVVANSHEEWELAWAAGVGTMNSPASVLAYETRALGLLLSALERQPALMARPGRIVLASSAGAVYAGSRDEVITEASAVAPTTEYAAGKLAQEELIAAFAGRCSHVAALIARIATLYGEGQSGAKRQGLLTHIARCMLRNQAVQIFVPLDTIRDYIHADDAALATLTAARAAPARGAATTKLIASEVPTTVAEIVAIFKRLARRPPRIVTASTQSSALYLRRMQFRSVSLPDCPPTHRRTLLVGVAQLMAAERQRFAAGT